MKKLITLSIAIFALYTATAQTSKKKEVKATGKSTNSKSKDADGIDGRMKGPNGEAIRIGEKGGRYYVNTAGNKVYVEYKGNDSKSAKKTITKAVKAVVGK